MLTLNNKTEKEEKLKINKVIVGIIIIMIYVMIIMVKNDDIKESSDSELLSSSTNNRKLLSNSISINISDGILLNIIPMSCYTNESYLYYQNMNTLNVSCTTSGYQLTGCSSYTESYPYGVTSDGKNCYTERIVYGPSEFPNEVYLQARCCKGNKDTLNIQYISKSNNEIIKNSCNELKCLNSNQTSMGTSITLGKNNNGYNQNYVQNQGNTYIDTSTYSLIYMNSGNITTTSMGLFCGNVKSYNLKCINVNGDVSSNGGDNAYTSIVNCTSGYKLTACDSQRSDFSCGSTSSNNGWMYGSYIDDNTCYSYGYKQRAVARCCTIA